MSEFEEYSERLRNINADIDERRRGAEEHAAKLRRQEEEYWKKPKEFVEKLAQEAGIVRIFEKINREWLNGGANITSSTVCEREHKDYSYPYNIIPSEVRSSFEMKLEPDIFGVLGLRYGAYIKHAFSGYHADEIFLSGSNFKREKTLDSLFRTDHKFVLGNQTNLLERVDFQRVNLVTREDLYGVVEKFTCKDIYELLVSIKSYQS